MSDIHISDNIYLEGAFWSRLPCGDSYIPLMEVCISGTECSLVITTPLHRTYGIMCLNSEWEFWLYMLWPKTHETVLPVHMLLRCSTERLRTPCHDFA